MQLAGHTFDSFLATLGASHRANIRRRLRALERLDARFDQVTAHDERRQMLDALAAFHAHRYADSRRLDGVQHASRARLPRRRHRGWRWSRLAADVRPSRSTTPVAAVMYGFSYGGRFYFYQHGYDAAQASQSVGLALMALDHPRGNRRRRRRVRHAVGHRAVQGALGA